MADRPHPLDSASLPSILTFNWVNGLIKQAWKQKGLKDEDVWNPAHDEDCRTTSAAFEAELAVQRDKIDTKKALFKTFKRPIILSAFMMLIYLASLCLGSFYFLSELLTWAGDQSPDRSAWRGWLFATLISLNVIISTFAIQLQFWFGLKAGVQMRGAVMAAVFRKATRISTVKSVGQVVNLISNDVQRLVEVTQWFNFGWGGPVAVVVVTILAVIRIGWPAVPGLALIVMLFGGQFYVGKQTQEIRRQAIQVTDRRVRHMNEILSSIKMIKLYAWETSFSQSVADIRAQEIGYIRSASMWKSLNFSVFFAAANISTLLIFAINFWRGRELSARTAFVVVALLNTLRFPVVMFPVAVKAFTDSTVSCNRLNEFFACPDIDPSQANASTSADAEGRALVFSQAAFRWDATDNDVGPTLRDVTLDVVSGKLLGVCGAVGTGKSTLLAAMLGQVRRVSGEMSAYGRVSFVAQQPWILNMTLRDNILFGAQVDEDKYQRVLDACCLLPDLAILPAGDRTEIGERGINLSGGQKARISLARAVYNNADVYLLDDPLSAVDQHVGKRLFNECINGLLRGKTVVLVTHQLQYLSKCDQVVFMVGGRIAGSGTFESLQASNEEFRQLIDTHVGEQDQEKETAMKPAAVGPAAAGANGATKVSGAGGLVMKEDQASASVGLTLYAAYAQFAGGIRATLLSFGLFFLTQAFNTFSSYWVSIWSANKLGLSENRYLYILAALTLFFVGMSIIRGFHFVFLTLRAAQRIHNKVFARVLMAPMYFFDSTPVGRILNRFSKDQEQIDDALPEALMNTVMYSFLIFATLILICILLPFFLVLTVPMAAVYVSLSYVYRFANRDLKRMEGVARSPLFAHLSATLQGLSSIRAYRVEDRFISENYAKVNRSNAFFFHFWALGRWLALRLDMIAATIILSVSYYGIIVDLDAGTYGLLMSQALAITGIFQWMVRAFADTEANLTYVRQICVTEAQKYRSVERQLYYLRELPSEPPRRLPGNEPPADWPSQGGVEFDAVTMKYREGLDPVLREVTFSVKPGEKIGIVGRTGAGKSTISLALFHIILHVSGSVRIDGVDIFKIGLDDLRSHLAVIPQDPVMFVGTMRHNLDPHHAYADVELWEALERVNLKLFVQAQASQLEMDIAENGENLSVGQRQLVCIARALLRKSKILFLDEATAAVDMATDQLIQQTLRTAFKDCTVFAIAHRLNTIIDSDKVLVMDGGRVAEYDIPATLLANPDSKFSKLVQETGKSMAKHLTKTAFSRRDMLQSIQSAQVLLPPHTGDAEKNEKKPVLRAKKEKQRMEL